VPKSDAKHKGTVVENFGELSTHPGKLSLEVRYGEEIQALFMTNDSSVDGLTFLTTLLNHLHDKRRFDRCFLLKDFRDALIREK